MKQKLFSLFYTLSSAVLAVAGMGCLASSFKIEINFMLLFILAFSSAAVTGVVAALVPDKKLRQILTAVLFVSAGLSLLIMREQLWDSAAGFVNIILLRLKTVYPFIAPLQNAGADPMLFAAALTTVLSMFFTAFLISTRSCLLVAVLTVAEIMPCYLESNSQPGRLPLLTCIVIIFAMFATRFYARRSLRSSYAVYLGSAAVITAAAILFSAVIPENRKPSDWQQNFAMNMPGYSENNSNRSDGLEIGDTVSLNKYNDLSLSDERELMIEDSNYVYLDLYLKGKAFSKFVNNTWIAESAASDPKNAYALPRSYDTEPPNQLYVTDLIGTSRAFMPYGVDADLLGDFGSTAINNDYEAVTVDNPCIYPYYLLDYIQSLGGADFQSYSDEVRRYAVPAEGVADVTEKYPVLSTAKNGSAAEKVMAVKQFIFDLDPEYSVNIASLPTGSDYLDWFINMEGGTKGWCIHYATAATLLLKQMGVPARYVSGYRVKLDDGKAVATQKERHSWAEYFDESCGWTPVETTPHFGYDDVIHEDDEPTQPTNEAEEETATAEEEQQAPENIQETTAPADASHNIEPKPGNNGIGDTNGFKIPAPVIVAAVILITVIAALALLFLRRNIIISRREKSIYNSPPTKAAVSLYRHLEKLTGKLGCEIPGQITDIAEKARFGKNGISSDELNEMLSFFESTEKRLQSSAGRLKKLYYKYLLCYY